MPEEKELIIVLLPGFSVIGELADDPEYDEALLNNPIRLREGIGANGSPILLMDFFGAFGADISMTVSLNGACYRVLEEKHDATLIKRYHHAVQESRNQKAGIVTPPPGMPKIRV